MSVVNRKKRTWHFLQSIFLPTILVVLFVWFLAALSDVEHGQAQTGAEQLEQSLRRACITCYATQGIYPPNLEYLEKEYGIQIDQDRYAVFYTIFASNLMPDITILELEQQ